MMTNPITEAISSGYNTSIQTLRYLNPETVATSVASAVTTVATAAIDGLSAIYFYPPNIFPQEVAFLDVPARALVMVPTMVLFVLPAMLGTAQLAYEVLKWGTDKAGKEFFPKTYSGI